MEEEILKRGLLAKCIYRINGVEQDATIVGVNVFKKTVSVVTDVDGDYDEKPYRYIKFEDYPFNPVLPKMPHTNLRLDEAKRLTEVLDELRKLRETHKQGTTAWFAYNGVCDKLDWLVNNLYNNEELQK